MMADRVASHPLPVVHNGKKDRDRRQKRKKEVEKGASLKKRTRKHADPASSPPSPDFCRNVVDQPSPFAGKQAELFRSLSIDGASPEASCAAKLVVDRRTGDNHSSNASTFRIYKSLPDSPVLSGQPTRPRKSRLVLTCEECVSPSSSSDEDASSGSRSCWSCSPASQRGVLGVSSCSCSRSTSPAEPPRGSLGGRSTTLPLLLLDELLVVAPAAAIDPPETSTVRRLLPAQLDCTGERSSSSGGDPDAPLAMSVSSSSSAPFALFEALPNEVTVMILACVLERTLPHRRPAQLRLLRQVCRAWRAADVAMPPLPASERLWRNGLATMLESQRRQAAACDYLTAIGKTRQQPFINAEMRSILVDWIIELCDEFKIDSETVFLTVMFIDRYLSRATVAVSRSRFQLVGIAALLIATKYEEVHAPTTADLVFYADETYSVAELCTMEANMLITMGFGVTLVTTRQFLYYFLQKIVRESEPICGGAELSDEAHTAKFTTVCHMADWLADLTLLDYQFTFFRPSVVAAAVVCTALYSLNLPHWPFLASSEIKVQHNVDLIREVAARLHLLYRDVAQLKLGTRDKYNKAEREFVSQRPAPATLIL